MSETPISIVVTQRIKSLFLGTLLHTRIIVCVNVVVYMYPFASKESIIHVILFL